MSATTDEMSIDQRRSVIELVAVDGLDILNGDDVPGRDDVIEYVLRAICLELSATSIQLEQETSPAVKVLGQWVGGLLGTGTVATDEVDLMMHRRGGELRDHIVRTIGWPNAEPVVLARDGEVTT